MHIFQNLCLGVLFKQKITYFLPIFTHAFILVTERSEGKHLCLLLYPTKVLGGTCNVLCTCICWKFSMVLDLAVVGHYLELNSDCEEGYTYQYFY